MRLDAIEEAMITGLLHFPLPAATLRFAVLQQIAALKQAGFMIAPIKGGSEARLQIQAMEPGTTFTVSSLNGTDRKAVYNAVTYAARCGEVERLGYGKYRRSQVPHG